MRVCLVRSLLKKPRPEREAFYRLWERKHGRPSALQLSRDVTAEWRRQGQA